MVADDHPVFREGLCRLLQDEGDLEVIAKPEDGEEAVRLANELLPDVAIIDVAMPHLNGIEAAEQIKAACPNIAILMLSAYAYESYLRASIRAGAAGYLLKSAPFNDVVSAVRLVHAGEAVFDFKVANRLLRQLAGDKTKETSKLEELYPRQLQILRLIAKAMSNREIATELSISERTVQTHLVNIFRKLGVASRTEAVLRAIRDGWLSIDELPSKEEM